MKERQAKDLLENLKLIDSAIDELSHRNQLLEKEIESLKRENEYLKKLIEILTKNDSPKAPSIPMPGIWPNPWENTQLPRNCPKCNLKLEGIMGYVCSHNDCPTGLAGPRCLDVL